MKRKILLSMALFSTFTFGTYSIAAQPAQSNASAVSKTTKDPYTTASLKSFKIATTNTKIYEKPSAKSSVIQKLKKGQGIAVLQGTKNGWTKVSLYFGKGYVKTSDLHSLAPHKNTHYARNINKTYEYRTPFNKGSEFKETHKSTFQKVYADNRTVTNFWLHKAEPDNYGMMEYETTKGLFTGYKEDGIATLAIKYPIKKQQTWQGSDGQVMKVLGTNQTVKTKDGSFKHVVMVKNGKGKNYSYYAPNIGLIKEVANGKTITEISAFK
ncbi:SH3 domain-containing protein [Rummeliibacillus stabekisii]|uniref:SH3 domain-containing protein n=1 Tax=Rummeliibacillus stabekisii TaxID=241244 RepID=UPI00116F24FF|nr:SH3 domain-containing protein [Rummeliibacillus stabekisii]MBB5169195.1 uncharacterized protein YgiM (DUF1202 family) [Rummeliibacillus stabekisii]GEL03456.1 hypothetical protein RST01_00830 [Rummeliibacillus stabekisii]